LAGLRLLIAIAFVLCGCYPRPETAYTAAQPRTAPVRNIGNFSEALRCMDDLFLAQGKRDIYITTAGIPDATGLIAAGTKEMFISSVSRMSAKSGAFRFVDYDPTQLDVQVLSQMIGLREDFVAPSYYVRGAITQLDSNVLASSAAAGVSVPGLDLGVSADQVVSVVSMDLNIGKLVTRQILPGISASNSIAVVQSGKGADLGGVIGKAGLSFSVSLDRSEGFHQAVRNLVELSTIEVLGKLTQVPYWECLRIEPTNPNFRAEAREWYDLMGEDARNRFARSALTQAGYPGASGSDAELSAAVARYQAANDLVPSGRVDFDLYYRLLANNTRQPYAVASGAPSVVSPVTAPAVATTAATPAPEVPKVLLATAHGPHPAYRVGETLSLQVQPTQDAYVYCYYQDATGTVARIFPNRFQPNAFVNARHQIEIPPNGHAFDIRFDKAGSHETVACLAANRELGLKLPDALKAQDLEPLPVRGLDDIAGRFRDIGGTQVDDARLAVEVTQ
jgi:hypothetical protein